MRDEGHQSRSAEADRAAELDKGVCNMRRGLNRWMWTGAASVALAGSVASYALAQTPAAKAPVAERAWSAAKIDMPEDTPVPASRSRHPVLAEAGQAADR